MYSPMSRAPGSKPGSPRPARSTSRAPVSTLVTVLGPVLSHPSSNKVVHMKYRLHCIAITIGRWTIWLASIWDTFHIFMWSPYQVMDILARRVPNWGSSGTQPPMETSATCQCCEKFHIRWLVFFFNPRPHRPHHPSHHHPSLVGQSLV